MHFDPLQICLCCCKQVCHMFVCADACLISPARDASVITVAATTQDDVMPSFSDGGVCVDVLGPGYNILSAHYSTDTGTAYALSSCYSCHRIFHSVHMSEYHTQASSAFCSRSLECIKFEPCQHHAQGVLRVPEIVCCALPISQALRYRMALPLFPNPAPPSIPPDSHRSLT